MSTGRALWLQVNSKLSSSKYGPGCYRNVQSKFDIFLLQINPSNPESRDGFEAHLRTMVAMMWAQAPGFPTGNHGLFHRFHIEAVTLQGYRVKGGKRAAGFPEMGR